LFVFKKFEIIKSIFKEISILTNKNIGYYNDNDNDSSYDFNNSCSDYNITKYDNTKVKYTIKTQKYLNLLYTIKDNIYEFNNEKIYTDKDNNKNKDKDDKDKDDKDKDDKVNKDKDKVEELILIIEDINNLEENSRITYNNITNEIMLNGALVFEFVNLYYLNILSIYDFSKSIINTIKIVNSDYINSEVYNNTCNIIYNKKHNLLYISMNLYEIDD